MVVEFSEDYTVACPVCKAVEGQRCIDLQCRLADPRTPILTWNAHIPRHRLARAMKKEQGR